MLSWNIKIIIWYMSIKAHLNGSNMYVYQTLSNIVWWCWMVFDQCWMVLDAGVFKRIQNHQTCCNEMAWDWLRRIFDRASKNMGQCWMKSLNKFKLHPTSSNTVQHVWSGCSNGSNMLRPTMFDNVWPTCLIRLNGP